MQFEEKKVPIIEREHFLSLQNRENMSLKGVDDVESFSEDIVVLLTNMGKLTIRGSHLHINQLNVENGELNMTGRVTLMEYSQNDKNKNGGFFASLFR